jgi:hypothetical protein
VLPATFSCKAISVHSNPNPGRQICGDFFHRLNGLSGGGPGRSRALHLGGSEKIVARHPERSRDLAKGRHRSKGDHFVGNRLGPHIGDVPDRQPERIVGLGGHPEGSTENIEVVDERPAHVRRESVKESRDGHSEHLRLGAIDVGVDLGRRSVEEREDLDETGRPVRPGDHASDRLIERARPPPGAVFDIHLEAPARADAGHRRRLNDEG